MITLHNLSPRPRSRFEKRRLGRGPGSGLGKTGGRGTKGQHSREGKDLPRGFEGGQTSLFRRIPKRGFVPLRRPHLFAINLRDLSSRLRGGEIVDAQWFFSQGLIRSKRYEGIRILGEGTIEVPVTFRVQGVSSTAQKKIESRGGKVEIVPPFHR
jgi:large subunit ribosomal protein L15